MHKIVKTVFLLAVFTLTCALVGLCSGILNNYTMIRQDGFIRYSCGFNHPNQAGCVVLAGCCSWAYTRCLGQCRSVDSYRRLCLHMHLFGL